jgi:hypothetical protein
MPTKIGLIKLLNEILSEVGDLENIEPYTDIEYHSPRAAYFYTDSGDSVDIEIETGINMFELSTSLVEIPKIVKQTWEQTKGNKDIINVNFLVNYSATKGSKTDLKEYYRIVKTVLDFTNDYVNKFKPFLVLIIAEEASSEKNTKNNFYSNIISRNINHDYQIIDNVKLKDGHKGAMLMRTK